MHVAIVGAGAAGLSIALTLHSRGIKCTIYESKEAPFRGLGALMLAPNALRILDSLGLYTQLRGRGFNFCNVEFRDESDSINDVWQMGNPVTYGYDALRITRPVFLSVLRSAVEERGIEVKYATKYSHVVNETAQNVTFQLVDGTQVTTDLLVGADGVHSDVRKHIAPTVQPQYSGNLAIIATVNHKFVTPDQSSQEPQTTFYYGKNSSVMILPQEHDGSQACIGTQRKYPEQSREDWVHLSYDKDRLYNLFMSDTSAWPQRVQDALSHTDKSNLYIWPFNTLPDLSSWTSLPHRRTILLGDAAHAIPPTGGQGACQAIEDAYTLAMVIYTTSRAKLSSDAFRRSIDTWQTARQQRIQRARMFTKQLDNNRLPPTEREKLPSGTFWKNGEHPDLSWLYGAGLANSAAKGVTRLEVRKEIGPGPLRIRAKTFDTSYGPPGSEQNTVQRNYSARPTSPTSS